MENKSATSHATDIRRIANEGRLQHVPSPYATGGGEETAEQTKSFAKLKKFTVRASKNAWGKSKRVAKKDSAAAATAAGLNQEGWYTPSSVPKDAAQSQSFSRYAAHPGRKTGHFGGIHSSTPTSLSFPNGGGRTDRSISTMVDSVEENAPLSNSMYNSPSTSSGGEDSVFSNDRPTRTLNVIAPPGKLEIVLEGRNKTVGTVVWNVRDTSVLYNKVFKGDQIIAVDDVDVSTKTVPELTNIMAKKHGSHRKLTIKTSRISMLRGSDTGDNLLAKYPNRFMSAMSGDSILEGGEGSDVSSQATQSAKKNVVGFKRTSSESPGRDSISRHLEPKDSGSISSSGLDSITSKYDFEKLVSELSVSANAAANKVAKLRTKLAALSKDQLENEKKLRLQSEKIELIDDQRTVAIELEDYTLAAILEEKINSLQKEESQCKEQLDQIGWEYANIYGAKNKKNSDGYTLANVAVCFQKARKRVQSFENDHKDELADKIKEAESNACKTLGSIIVEEKKIEAELDELEVEESRVVEERKELEVLIDDQTLDMREKRDLASFELNSVYDEIKELKKKLAEKEEETEKINNVVSQCDMEIAKEREKFSPQLENMSEMERAVRSKRDTHETNKGNLVSMKEQLDKEEEDKAFFQKTCVDFVKQMEDEVSAAEQLEKFFSSQQDVRAELTQRCHDNESSKGVQDDNSKLWDLHADVIRCEAEVEDSKQELISAESELGRLENRIAETDARLSDLKAEKVNALSRNDFSAADNTSKQIEGATYRRENCKEEIACIANEQIFVAKKRHERNLTKLERKKQIVSTKEKEQAMETMDEISNKIRNIKQLQKSISPAAEKDQKGVAAVGCSILDKTIDTLSKEGCLLASKIGVDWNVDEDEKN